jgi:hypothetical protein
MKKDGLNCLDECPYSYKNRNVEKVREDEEIV